jgi:hypothetical protein
MIVHFNPSLPMEQRKDLWTSFMQDVAPQFR